MAHIFLVNKIILRHFSNIPWLQSKVLSSTSSSGSGNGNGSGSGGGGSGSGSGSGGGGGSGNCGGGSGKDSGSRSSISGTMTAYLDGFLSHIQVALLKGREENIITKNLQRVAGEIWCLIHVLKQPSRSTNHNVCFSNSLLLMFQILYKDKPVS